jgi:uncharacterized protein involved in exopolysaccharide biosynthesis
VNREPSGSDDFGVQPAPNESTDRISVLELVNVMLKRRRLTIVFPIVVAFMAAIISLVVSPRFTATATFVPEAESEELSLPGLAGLAAQFGVAIPVGGGGNTPQFYADVLKSRTLRDAVLSATFFDPRADSPTDSATLLDLLRVKGESERKRLERGRKRLKKAIAISVDAETRIVRVSAETRYRQLSADVANLYLGLLNRFNLETRQSNAQERRRFIETSMSEAEGELVEAEEELKGFLERNRQFQGSPELQFQYERLQRRVSIKQEVFTELRRQYEEARIQEVNDTPVITVIDRAVPPEDRSSPKRKLNVILALIAALVFGAFTALGGEFVQRARDRQEQGVTEFNSHWEAIRSELGSMFRRFRVKRS